MKKIYLSILLLAATIGVAFSQVPNAFNYQAVVRNSSGEILANKTVSFRISLLKNSESGAVVYSETHSLSTNDFGLVNFKIGKGTKLSGTFSPSDWGEVIFTKVEFDPAGGSSFSHLATTKLSSVPFAFVAQTVVNDKVDDADADPANEIQTLSLNNNLLKLSNGGGQVTLPTSGGSGGDNWGAQTVKTDATLTGNGTSGNLLHVVADGDGDDTNELQTLSKTGNSIELSNGGGSVTDEVEDADADPANEIQTLSISGSNLSLSDGGGTVALPESPWSETSTEVSYKGSKNVVIGKNSALSSINSKVKISGDDKYGMYVVNTAETLPAILGYNTTVGGISGYFYHKKGIALFSKAENGAAGWFESEKGEDPTVFIQNNSKSIAAKIANNASNEPTADFDNRGGGLAAYFHDAIRITDGNQGTGKVLTSDAHGNASWQSDLSVNDLTASGDVFVNQNLEVSDDMTVGSISVSAGEISKSTTGTSNNLLPFAYGTITNSGGKIGCTSNVGTITKISTGQFTVNITGLGTDYTVVITPSKGASVTGAVYRSKGFFNGLIWDTKNDKYFNGGFSFIVYKP